MAHHHIPPQAAMKPGSWPKAAPWIRRHATLAEKRQERQPEAPGVSQGGPFQGRSGSDGSYQEWPHWFGMKNG